MALSFYSAGIYKTPLILGIITYNVLASKFVPVPASGLAG